MLKNIIGASVGAYIADRIRFPSSPTEEESDSADAIAKEFIFLYRQYYNDIYTDQFPEELLQLEQDFTLSQDAVASSYKDLTVAEYQILYQATCIVRCLGMPTSMPPIPPGAPLEFPGRIVSEVGAIFRDSRRLFITAESKQYRIEAFKLIRVLSFQPKAILAYSKGVLFD